MADLKEALPAAFDAADEKGHYEQEAYKLYCECENALVPSAASTEATAPKKRERGEESSEERVDAKCGLSQALIVAVMGAHCIESGLLDLARSRKSLKPRRKNHKVQREQRR